MQKFGAKIANFFAAGARGTEIRLDCKKKLKSSVPGWSLDSHLHGPITPLTISMFLLSILKVFYTNSLYFIQLICQDTMGIHPINFGVPKEQAIIAELNKKYANRVLHNVGLCICVFDLCEAGEGKVRYGDGLLWYKGEHQRDIILKHANVNIVIFRMVVFRPFSSEVILAKVKSSDEDGIRRESQQFT